MKAQTPDAVAKSTTRWIVAAFLLLLYCGILTIEWPNVNGLLRNVISNSISYGEDRNNLSSFQEVYRTAWGYSGDYYLHPSKWDEHLEQDALTWAAIPLYQQLIDEARQSVDETQKEIDALQSVKEGSP